MLSTKKARCKPGGRVEEVWHGQETGHSTCDSFPIGAIMRDKIHPEYREVIFKDTAADFAFMSRSTVKTKDTIQWSDGKTYPLVKLDISSASHPFFTGKMKLLDSAGQIDRFNKRFANYGKKKEEAAATAAK